MASSICTVLMNIIFYWLADTDVPMFKSPLKNITKAFVLTFSVVSTHFAYLTWMVCEMGGKWLWIQTRCSKISMVKNTFKQMKYLTAWKKKHFKEHFNTVFSQLLNPLKNISREKIKVAVKMMKSRKVLVVNIIMLEVIKADGESVIEILHKIFLFVLGSRQIPKDWSRMFTNSFLKKRDKLNPEIYNWFLSQAKN